MIRLNITTEGQTEEEFVSRILAPHLANFGKQITARSLRTSDGHRGGYSNFDKVKRDVEQWLKEEPGAWHTTLLDLYGLNAKFPGYEAAKHLPPYQKVAHVEQAFGEHINFWRFFPFVQLHELETLLYAEPDVMQQVLGMYRRLPANHFAGILAECGTPELINDSRETAPSKRILQLCPNYDKITEGLLILEEIGLERIRQQCPHFNEWVTRLEQLT